MKHFFAAYFRISFVLGIFLIFQWSCSVIDPAEEIPSYLHIDSLSLTAVGGQGTSTSSITDAWVYMDGALLGGFELPCNIPILAEGAHNFLICGGVKMNGLSSTRAIYPFWKGWEGSITLSRREKTTINPVITYFSTVDFINNWMENFESAGISLVPETNSATLRKDSMPYAFEDLHSGYVHLNNTDSSLFIAASSTGYSMPPSNDTWIEFNYWCDGPFTVGIENANNPNIKFAWLEVEPSWAWKKIYIRLTDVLASSTLNVNYKIYFAMQNPSSQSESHLYLDNIKLLK